MNDIKNIALAFISSATSVFAAIESRESFTIVSAIVLPVVLFAIGKTIDVLLQIYLHRLRSAGKDPGIRTASKRGDG